jgi:hypothetical protein
MKYPDGQEIRVGDQVTLGNKGQGIVVFSIDRREYSDDYLESEWGYLKRGVMVRVAEYGLIYFEDRPDPDLCLTSRKDKN